MPRITFQAYLGRRKTAIGLVSGLGSIEDIYANLDKVATLSFRGAKTMADKLIEHKDAAFYPKH